MTPADRFRVGTPCAAFGHTLRYVSTGNCVACASNWRLTPDQVAASKARRADPAAKATARDRHLARAMGTSTAESDAQLAWQGGVCAYPGCGKAVDSDGRRLHQDHEHGGLARSVLCRTHNHALSYVEDADFLAWAQAYIAWWHGVN
jgi:hypothetical protein